MSRLRTEYRHFQGSTITKVTKDSVSGMYYVGNSDVVVPEEKLLHHSQIMFNQNKNKFVKRKPKVSPSVKPNRSKNLQWFNAWGVSVPGPEWVDYAHTSDDL